MTPAMLQEQYMQLESRPERRAIKRIHEKIHKRGLQIADFTVILSVPGYTPLIAYDELLLKIPRSIHADIEPALKEFGTLTDADGKNGISANDFYIICHAYNTHRPR